MILINDTTLSILPNMFAEYGYLFFNQTISGQIIGGIKKENIPHPDVWAGRSPIFKLSFDNSITFQPSESDTLFRINGTKMVPVYSLLLEKPRISRGKTSGSEVSYLYSDKNRLFFAETEYESINTPTNASINITGEDYLSFDLKTLDISNIDHFSLESIDMDLKAADVHFYNMNQIIIVYQAMDFKKIIDEVIKRESVTESKKEWLRKIKSEISENDNPIIITGKWK